MNNKTRVKEGLTSVYFCNSGAQSGPRDHLNRSPQMWSPQGDPVPGRQYFQLARRQQGIGFGQVLGLVDIEERLDFAALNLRWGEASGRRALPVRPVERLAVS